MKRREEGVIGADDLRKIEDDCILEAVKVQEDVGLKGITDGEFRRTNWSSDFLTAIDGVGFGEGKVRASFHRADGTDLERNVTSLAASPMNTSRVRSAFSVTAIDRTSSAVSGSRGKLASSALIASI